MCSSVKSRRSPGETLNDFVAATVLEALGAREPAAGAPERLDRHRLCGRLAGNAHDAVRNHRVDGLCADRHGARAWYFKQFGIESIISKEASWAVIRDKLSIGDNQATHMLIGMPIASTMGLAGSPVKPMVIPWL